MFRSYPVTLLMTLTTGQLLPPHTVADLKDFFKYYLEDPDVQICELHVLREEHVASIRSMLFSQIGLDGNSDAVQSLRWPIEQPFEEWFSRNHHQLSSHYVVKPLSQWEANSSLNTHIAYAPA